MYRSKINKDVKKKVGNAYETNSVNYRCLGWAGT